jgi:hypothetical protein
MHDLKEFLEQALDHLPPAAGADPGPDLIRGRNVLRRRRRLRAASVTAACTAVCVAATVLVVTGGSTGTHQRQEAAASGQNHKHTGTSTGTVTAAVVRHLASASRSALAYSGRALVSYSDSGQAVQPSYGTEAITFSGSDWNDVLREYLVHPTAGVRNPQYAINRIVDGQVYYYFIGNSGGFWVHNTSPGAVQAVNIPDPRTLLAALQPDAGFTIIGYQVSGGIRLEQLRATKLSALTAFANSLAWALPGEHLAGLSLWVDRSGVVHRMAVGLSGTEVTYQYPGGLEMSMKNGKRVVKQIPHHGKRIYRSVATSLTITFTGIGQPQAITAPSSFTNVHGQG